MIITVCEILIPVELWNGEVLPPKYLSNELVNFSNMTTIAIANSTFEAIGSYDYPIIRGNILGGIRFNKKISLWMWGEQSSSSSSKVTIDNSDGYYDYLFDYRLRDAKIKIKHVKPNEHYSNAVIVGEYLIDSITGQPNNTIDILLVDKMTATDVFTTHEIFPNTVPNMAIRDLEEPIALGYNFQVPVTLIDEVNNRYQCHSGASVASFGTLSDRIDPFVLTTDYTTITVAETGGQGYDLTVGNAKIVTADFEGEPNTKTFAGLISYLIDNHTDLTIVGDFHPIAILQNGEFSNYLETPINVKSLINSTCESQLLFYYSGIGGKIFFSKFQTPEQMLVSPLRPTVYEASIENNTLFSGVKIELDAAPKLTDKFLFDKNNFQFNFDDISDIGGVSDYDKMIATQQYRSSIKLNIGIDKTYKHALNAEPLAINGRLSSAEHNRLMVYEMYKKRRFFHTFDYKHKTVTDAAQMLIGGNLIHLIYDKYGLSNVHHPTIGAGKALAITEINGDYTDNITAIVGWG